MIGGTTRCAGNRRICVVRGNGSVETGYGRRWFKSAGEIQPGDTDFRADGCAEDEAVAAMDCGDDDSVKQCRGGCRDRVALIASLRPEQP
jgi:hypothetical protein